MSRDWEQSGRFELKYVLPMSWRSTITGLISPFAEADPHAHSLGEGRRGYVVHSLYLDTPQLDDYNARLAGDKVRNRLRVRSYDTPATRPPVFLENKRKSGRQVVKHRFKLCDAGEWLCCRDDRPWRQLLDSAALETSYPASVFTQLVDGGNRRPVSVVCYEREVFVPRGRAASSVRLTLDHHVRGARVSSPDQLFAPADLSLIPTQWMVMELKFAGAAPGWMHMLRRELSLGAVPVSKYGLSVARTVRGDHPRELRTLTPRPLLTMECPV